VIGFKQDRQNGKYTPQGNIGYKIDTTHFNARADSIELVTIVLVLSLLASGMSAICNEEVT
jgi:hypothetical protein